MMEKPVVLWGEQDYYEDQLERNSTYHLVNFDKVSDASGNFTSPNYPTVVLDIDPETYLANFSGLTLLFDAQFSNWATSYDIILTCQDGGTTTTYTIPGDGDSPYVWKAITASWDPTSATLDGMSIVIYSARRGNSVLPFNGLRFGQAYEIPNKYIRALDVTQSCDFSGITAPYSKMTCVCDAEGLDVILGYRQKVKLSTNVRQVGEYYVDSITKTGDRTYQIIAIDSLGCLASEKFGGAVYNGESIYTILLDILGPYPYSFLDFSVTTVTGLIPECDKRTALLHLAIYCGCVLVSQYRYNGLIGIAFLKNTTVQHTDVIPRDMTYIGPKVAHEDEVTDYTITSHSFAANTNGDVVIGNTRYRDTRTENAYTRAVLVGNKTTKTLSQATLVSAGAVLGRAKDMLVARYDRTAVWQGSYVWAQDSGDLSGHLGSGVWIYDGERNQLRGAVQKADLHFSGATIKVDAEILSYQLFDTPVLYYDEVDGFFSASGPGEEYELYRNGELVASFSDEYYISTPGEYYVISVSSNNGYSYHSNTITIE